METSTYHPATFRPTYIPAYPPLSFSPARSSFAEPADWLSLSKDSDKSLLGSKKGPGEQEQRPGRLQRRLKSRHSKLQRGEGERGSGERAMQLTAVLLGSQHDLNW